MSGLKTSNSSLLGQNPPEVRGDQHSYLQEKFQIGTEVKFPGFIVSAEGVKPDPEKVKYLKEFPVPTNLAILGSYIQLASQLGSFLPELRQSMIKICSLLKKDTVLLWTPEIQAKFERSKQVLTSPMMVKPLDPALRTGLLTDAARLQGLGYILLQWKQGEEAQTLIIQ